MNDFIATGICLKTRRIFLYGDVEEENVGKVIRALYAMAAMDSEERIMLFVSSYGGSLDDSMALVDTMRALSCPVYTVALGKCMSAAPLIVAAGEPGFRFAMPNTSWMLHDVSQDVGAGCPAWISGMAAAGKVIIKKYALLLDIYTERRTAHWTRIFRMKSDKFFTSADAFEWGIVDEVFDDELQQTEEEE